VVPTHVRYRALIHRLVALAEAVDPAQALEAGGNRGGLITYRRELAHNRGIGWQFREGQLRFQITIEDPDLQGEAGRPEREEIVKTEQLGFNPAFVYRHRPVKRSVSTARLAEALVAMTRRVDDFADKAGYDTG
jgi:hypothetical protein